MCVPLDLLNRRNKALVHELSQALPGTQDLSFPTQFARSFAGQLSSCLWKQNLTYWRSPDYNLVRFVFTLITSVVFGTIFWQIGVKRWNPVVQMLFYRWFFLLILFLNYFHSLILHPWLTLFKIWEFSFNLFIYFPLQRHNQWHFHCHGSTICSNNFHVFQQLWHSSASGGCRANCFL